MSKKEELKQTYLKDVDLAASKSKFGFFNIPAPVFAAEQTFLPKKIQRDQNGKLKTQERNIFSGLCATGVLKKNFFSYPQYKTGDPYQDPGKVDRVRQMKTNLKYQDKQKFRPASLNKTIATASYEYVPQKQTRKDPKKYRNDDGRVVTQNPNITSNPSSKIQYKSMSNLKYMNDPYQNAKLLRRKQLQQDISKRGQNPFKGGSPIKDYFASNKQKYGQVNVPQKKTKKIDYNIQEHDTKFKPSGNHFNDGTFSYPKYMPLSGENVQENMSPKKADDSKQKKEPFRLIKVQKNSKPCPSVSFSKMNLMRSLRC